VEGQILDGPGGQRGQAEGVHNMCHTAEKPARDSSQIKMVRKTPSNFQISPHIFYYKFQPYEQKRNSDDGTGYNQIWSLKTPNFPHKTGFLDKNPIF